MLYNEIKSYSLNFGPQHPAAHGVLRLLLDLDSEIVVRCDPHIGLLHRGTEKLCEYKTFFQNIPYLDRLDYVSVLCEEHTYALAVEELLGVRVSTRCSLLRIVLDELTRILNHLLAISCHAADVGAITPILWGFEEREKLMMFYEWLSGARLHAAYIRPGSLQDDISLYFLDALYYFCLKFISRVDELEDVLSKGGNIWVNRLINVGLVTADKAINYGFTGPMLRSTGCIWDIRNAEPYDNYELFYFRVPFGIYGDSYDRYLIRIEEMRQSVMLIMQCLNSLTMGVIHCDDNKVILSSPEDMKSSMESMIHHFQFYTKGFMIPEGSTYNCIEAPKGEFGVYLATDGNECPYRCHFRSPGFHHLQGLHYLAKGLQLADIVAIIGTQDIVFGEIDR